MKSASKTARSTKFKNGSAITRGTPAETKILTATSLKAALWDTLNAVKNDTMLPAQGDAIASQAREILRTIKVQLQIVGQSKRTVPIDVIEFAEQS